MCVTAVELRRLDIKKKDFKGRFGGKIHGRCSGGLVKFFGAAAGSQRFRLQQNDGGGGKHPGT